MKINVIDDKGAEKIATIITSFRLASKKYIIYTFFEEDVTGSIRIYISELRIKQNSYSFNNIISDDEWENVKRIMKEFAKGVSNLENVVSSYDIEVVLIDKVMNENEYNLATIKDSKVVKVSSKFIEGLFETYNELVKSVSAKEDDGLDVIQKEDANNIEEHDELSEDDVLKKEQDARQKMKDIWEYSSMLQKKIADDMKALNSKVIKLDSVKYYVDVKDPLYLKEKIDLQVPKFDDSRRTYDDDNESESDNLLNELEPVSVPSSSDNTSIFSKLEKELSGINQNFNKIVAKNQEEKARIASEIEKRLQEVALKEKKLNEFEEKLNLREEELRLREKELVIANERLEDDIRSLTKYASMLNSMMNED